jgi:hypothetical protein
MVADEREGWAQKTIEQYEEMSGVGSARLDKLWEAWQEKKGEMRLPLDVETLKYALR